MNPLSSRLRGILAIRLAQRSMLKILFCRVSANRPLMPRCDGSEPPTRQFNAR